MRQRALGGLAVNAIVAGPQGPEGLEGLRRQRGVEPRHVADFVVGDVDFKIEDNVPLPATARPVRYFPFDKLKPGQSFLVLKDQRAGLRTSLAACYKSSGETRTIIMRRQDDESIRVWKK